MLNRSKARILIKDCDKKKKEYLEKKNEMMNKERWLHDKYDENDQFPKSSFQLEQYYGYNIRSGEGFFSKTVKKYRWNFYLRMYNFFSIVR